MERRGAAADGPSARGGGGRRDVGDKRTRGKRVFPDLSFHFEFVHRRIESVLEEVEAAAPWFDKDLKALVEQVAELRAR